MDTHSHPFSRTDALPRIDVGVQDGWFAEDDGHALSPAARVLSLNVSKVPVGAMTIRLPKIPVRTTGFQFPESPLFNIPVQSGRQPAPADPIAGSTTDKTDDTSANPKSKGKKGKKNTRLSPPKDMVKLQDRLYYLLQPPLEHLVNTGRLTFPFEPFPYQLDGLAFLYPRYSAILADEMGLGKTMQAISTMRMLLHSGAIRRVLLICPKPLVSNWLREFSVWAPEIPIAAIEGNAARREFQWSSPDVPVQVANYELLMRDREQVLGDGQHFDLVVLDEAQRIKNRDSTTSKIIHNISRTRSWALTGTPIENSTQDLVGVFHFLSPGYLHNDMSVRELGNATREYVLRRVKDEVLDDMPPKLYRDAELDLTPQQWDTYETAEREGVISLEEMDQ
ncbi:MAG: SNF2-related protein, partial [Planctomycetota bacterium]